MNDHRTTIAAAGNTLASALACIRASGYAVTVEPNGKLLRAVGTAATLLAEDLLSLLGLVKLYEVRGPEWKPTDAEVEALLASIAAEDLTPAVERVDVWEESGAVHVLCVTREGDPVELNTSEARVFAEQLAKAIRAAE
jgi:hypothetical protein